MDQEKIGKFIALKRKEKNFTQKEFALKLNVTDKTVSRWENGYYLPDVSLFKDVNIELLIDDEYLSDLVRSGKANKEQQSMYESIERHEKAIVEEQSFGALNKDVSEEFAPISDIVTILEAEQKTDRYSND